MSARQAASLSLGTREGRGGRHFHAARLRVEAEKPPRNVPQSGASEKSRCVELSRWKIEEKKRFDWSSGGGLRAGDALYDSKRFSHL